MLFNCENGTFDIRTGELRTHNSDDFITHYCAIPYEPGFRNERWEAFLEKVQPSKDIRDFLRRAAGYSFTGLANEEALFFCYGEGATGKSTYLETLLGCAASYGDVSKFATFLADRTTSGGSPREDITRLMGLRLTVCNEVNKNTRFNGALLKTLVSGELHVARVPYSPQSVSFEPIFKLWLAANDRPKIDYDDDAAFRRFHVVPFNVVIPRKEQDKNLKSYFKHDSDAQKAVLAWGLEGAVEWYKLSDGGRRDGLRAPTVISEATQAYQFAMNPLYEFLQNECAVGCDKDGKPFEVDTTSLWAAYHDAQYDIRKVRSAASLGRFLGSLGFERFQDNTPNRVRKWRYLRLLGLDEEPTIPNCTIVNQKFRTLEHLEGSFSQNSLHEVAHEKVCDFCLCKCSCVHDSNPLAEQKTIAAQAILAQRVKEALESWRSANSYNEKEPLKRSVMVDAVAMLVYAQHPEHEPDYLTHFVERLSSEDKEIGVLMLELTR